MEWDDVVSPFIFKEGEIISYATTEGVYFSLEVVKVECPICLEEFLGNKKHAGHFISGHRIYHEFEHERAEYYGGT